MDKGGGEEREEDEDEKEGEEDKDEREGEDEDEREGEEDMEEERSRKWSSVPDTPIKNFEIRGIILGARKAFIQRCEACQPILLS